MGFDERLRDVQTQPDTFLALAGLPTNHRVAAPIRGPDGATIGAIDLSTSAADGSPDSLALLAHVAFVVEQELKSRYARRAALSRADFISERRLKMNLAQVEDKPSKRF
jgi:hypothetical protein